MVVGDVNEVLLRSIPKSSGMMHSLNLLLTESYTR